MRRRSRRRGVPSPVRPDRTRCVGAPNRCERALDRLFDCHVLQIYRSEWVVARERNHDGVEPLARLAPVIVEAALAGQFTQTVTQEMLLVAALPKEWNPEWGSGAGLGV